MEAVYFAFGDRDVVAILDLPDNVTAAGLSLAVSATGLVQIKTTPLLIAAEVDQALKVKSGYKAPGKAK